MSVFRGRFSRLPGVACDNFDADNSQADQFFLSHCHADHMTGLEHLCRLLISRNDLRTNHRLFCSAISKHIILRKFSDYLEAIKERFITVLEPDTAKVVRVYDKGEEKFYQLRVTAIPADHCLGSIMFLFETLDEDEKANYRILYTGDFRFENKPLKDLVSLHTSEPPECVNSEDNRDELKTFPKTLDELYLDTTFCHPQYETFPSREKALEELWKLVSSWIKKNGMYRYQRAKHVVLLHLPAQYGSERILRELYRKSRYTWRIHVDSCRFDDYLCAEELRDCTSDKWAEAQWIHACTSKKEIQSKREFAYRLPCKSLEEFEVRQIKPSAMYFKKDRNRGDEDIFVNCRDEYYRVCYSCHSSLNELIEFVKYFKPKHITPCVVPSGMTSEEVQNLLQPAMQPELSQIHDSPLLEALGSQGDENQNPATSPSESDPRFRSLASFSSPDSSLERKRKGSAMSVDRDSPSPKRSTFNDLGQGDSGSRACSSREVNTSDEDDFPLSAKILTQRKAFAMKAGSRRQLFQRSKSNRANYSMPVIPSSTNSVSVGPNQQNRRASLPHNLKIPQITITPSSPSPDPNHPDYPEFFEDKLYIESKNMSTSSESSSATPVRPVPVSKESSMCRSEMDVDEVTQATNEAAFVMQTQLEGIIQGKVEGDEEPIVLFQKARSEDMDSTPPLEEIFGSTEAGVMHPNCDKFDQGVKRKRKKLENQNT